MNTSNHENNAKQVDDNKPSSKEAPFSTSFDAKKAPEIQESIAINSSYISPKPDTTFRDTPNSHINTPEKLDISPLNAGTLSSIKNFQLSSVAGSKYSTSDITEYLNSFGTYAFDNILKQLQSTTTNYYLKHSFSPYTTGNDTLYGLDGADILYGQDGADILFGGENSDRFIFEGTTAFNGIDRIEDFDVLEQDVIDISDVLTGYTKGVDDINDFIRFTDIGSDSIMEIDADGLAGGTNFEAVTLIVGGAGLDALTLETSGHLDTVI